MQSLKRAILSPRTAYALLGMAVLTALIFTWGPAISIGGEAPLGTLAGQIGAAMLAPIGFGVVMMAQDRIRGAVQRRVTDALGGLGLGGETAGSAGSGAEAGDAALRQEVQAVAARFRLALQTLKGRRFAGAGGRRWLYQLPWYVVIGPPGSGKTTAITNSGLTFPLADRFGKTALAGIGGTRNCDWWFTDDAVLIDTAGRYMTQDSAAERDKAAWLGFLRLLRRFRRRQPLNGVIIAIGISELTTASEAVRQDHAARIRQRIGELYRELGLRLPVYVLLTKFDLIAGFVEFFDDLGQEERGAVWGVTFPQEGPEPEGGHVAGYGQEFDALVRRLDERLIERMQREGDIRKRALAFGFPQQVASLKGLTRQFLADTFAPNSFEEPVLLRGVYFVSGTQLGTPLDRVTEAMARSFAVERRPPAAFNGRQRSYFLRRLLQDVVFPEAGLVERNPNAARRQARLRLTFCAAAGLVLATGGAVWSVGFARNARLVEAVRGEAAGFAAQAGALGLDQVADGDPLPVLPPLGRLGDLAARLERERDLPGGSGLDQAGKLATQARAAYRSALNAVLLPRLVLRLEAVLAAGGEDPVLLHEAFKVYLMLGQQGPLRRQAVRDWMREDWKASLPGEEHAAARTALTAHLDALLDGPLAGAGLNGPLVAQLREALQRVPLPRLVLNAILAHPDAARLPPWRLADIAGPAAQEVLRRRSGQPLTAGIPGIFTAAGFHGPFLRLLPAAAQAQAEDRWVTAPPGGPAQDTPEAARRLQRETTELYLRELTLHWDQLIGDVTTVPMRSVADALRVLNVLAAPTSPLRLLLVGAVAASALDQPPAGDDAPAPSRPAAPFRPARADESPAGLAARYAAEHFRPLRALVEVPQGSQAGAQAPIDDVIRDLDRLYRSLSELQGGAADPVRGGEQTAAALGQIERRAAGLPPPINQWVLGLGRTTSDLSADGARQRLGELWRNGPAPACQRATEGRFPFVRGAAPEVPLGEFGRLFGRGGTIDGFFNANLRSVVDTGRSPWRSLGTGEGEFRLAPQALGSFERAAAIRDSLFPDGGARPSLGFSLALADLGPATAAVMVELDGRRLDFPRGDAAPRRLRWPGTEDAGSATLTFLGPDGAPVVAASGRGAWALFRLLQAGEMQPRGESVLWRLAAGPHQASLTLTADGPVNPFAGGLLAGFRCPASL